MRSRSRRGWIWTISLLAGAAVLAAALSSLFRLAVDAVPGYRHEVEQRVAQAVGHPLRIGSMALTWYRLEPTLDLRDVELLDEADSASPALLHLGRLQLGFSLWRLVRTDWAPVRVELRGLVIHADRDAQGQWRLRGLDIGAGSGSGSAQKWLQRLEQLQLLHCRLEINDAQLGGAPLELQLVLAELIHRGDDFTAHADFTPPASIAAAAELHGELRGDLSQPAKLRGGATLAIHDLSGWPWLTGELAPGVVLQLSGAQLRIDGALADGRVSTLAVSAQAASAVAQREGRTLAQFTQFRFEAKAHPTAQCWQAELGRLELSGARGVWSAGSGRYECTRAGNEGPTTTLGGSGSIDLLRLDDLAPWLGLWKSLPSAAQRLVDLRGDLRGISVSALPPDPDDRGEPRTYLQVAAALAGVGLAADGNAPGFSGIDGQLRADNDSGQLSLEHIAPQLNLPQTFARALPMDTFSSVLNWRHEGRDWHLWTPAFTWQAVGTQGAGRFDLLLADNGMHPPQLTVSADFSGADVTLLKPFIPVDWNHDTREWLTRALVAGRVPKGSLILDGPLPDFPFVESHNGRWGLNLQLADVTLAFSPDWPALEGLQGRLKLQGHGISIDADRARLHGNSVDHIAAAIDDFRTSQLVIDGAVHGDAQDFYAVLRQSPLHRQLSGLVDKTDASGTAHLDLHLQLALAESPIGTHASGQVALDDVTLAVHGLAAPIRNVVGVVDFNATGVTADALNGSFYDLPISARIHPEDGVPTGVLEAQTQLPLAAEDGLAAAYLPDWLRRELSGTTEVHGRLPLGGVNEGKLTLTSDLAGIASKLPPPLAKTPAGVLPLNVHIGGDAQIPLHIGIEVSDVMRIGLRFADTDDGPVVRGVEARLDGGVVPRADANGIVITGAPAELDLAPWLPFVADTGADPPEKKPTEAKPPEAKPPEVKPPEAKSPETKSTETKPAAASKLAFVSADLTPGRLHYDDFVLVQPHLHAVPEGEGYRVDLNGDSAQGSIAWSPIDRGHVVARLQHLKFEPLPATGAVADDTQAGTADTAPFAPRHAPTLDLTIDKLLVGEADLGNFELQTSRIPDGQQLDALRLTGGDLQLDSKGDWRRAGAGDAGQSSAEFSFSITATRIGTVLTAFGYASTLSAKQANFKGALAWAPDPQGLQLAQATGQIDLDLQKGNLKSVQPGAGRVLGLLNLYALPRRLLLDFHDVVSKGLAFDKLTGRLALAGGQANTDNVVINSPSVKIQMRGRIGLAAHDVDEHVTVYPDVTTGVTVGAALVGGPVGALVALVAQEALGKPFNKLSKFSYHITGPWDNPQIEHGAGNKTAEPVVAPAEDQPKPAPEKVDE